MDAPGPVSEAATAAALPASEREVMSWAQLGVAARDLAAAVHADGYAPDMILGVARGGLLPAASVGYALGVKNTCAMSVEFYTGVEERLDVPMVLPPVPQLVDVAHWRLLIVDDVADTGATLEVVRALLRRQGRRDAHGRPLREARLGRQVRLRLAPHRPLDRLPVERRAARRHAAAGPRVGP